MSQCLFWAGNINSKFIAIHSLLFSILPRVFGCVCFLYHFTTSKLSLQAVMCIFWVFKDTKGRLMFRSKHFISVDVTFMRNFLFIILAPKAHLLYSWLFLRPRHYCHYLCHPHYHPISLSLSMSTVTKRYMHHHHLHFSHLVTRNLDHDSLASFICLACCIYW